MIELFLACALTLPASSFTRPTIVSWHAASSEEERLKDWLRKHNEIDDVFIHPNPQKEKLKEHGWEKVPFTWRGNEIWIQRKPKTDKKLMEASA